jgi:hypothetical protein
LWALPSCRRRKAKIKQKYWIHKVFRTREEEEGEFHNLFGRLKDGRQNIFKYFRMSSRNLKT